MEPEPLPDPAPPEFHDFITIACERCGKTIEVPVYCGNRFCPVCSKRRLNRVRRRLDWIISQYRLPRGYRFKHLTLTVPNQQYCDDMVKHLIKSFRKLRQRAAWKNRVLGGAYVLEITGRPNNWHVHIHAIIVSRYFDWDQIFKLWLGCSGGRGVFIQNIPAGQVTRYLTKYLSKPSVPDMVLEDVNWALKGTRLFSPFGDWHALNLKYLVPKCLCKECGGANWYPLSLVYSDHLSAFSKELPQLSKPPPLALPLPLPAF